MACLILTSVAVAVKTIATTIQRLLIISLPGPPQSCDYIPHMHNILLQRLSVTELHFVTFTQNVTYQETWKQAILSQSTTMLPPSDYYLHNGTFLTWT